MNLTIFETIGGVFLFLLIIYLYQRQEYKKRKKVFQVISDSSTYENIAPIKKELAKSFYYRYSSAKMTAYGILVLTIIIIVGGAYFFYNASSIAKADAVSIPVGSQRWLDVQDSLQKKYFSIFAEPRGIAQIRGEYYKYIDSIRLQYKTEIDKETEDVFKEDAKKLENEVQKTSLSTLVASMIIRVMISFFVFYLVQIFLKLYRYNLKVSDFYINKYDAILSYEEMKLPFDKTIEVFSHTIDVGNVPKSPVETALEILKVAKDNKG